MPLHANAPVHHESSASSAPWLTKFVKETVDDALSLLGHGQARFTIPCNILSNCISGFCGLRGQVPLEQLAKVLARLRDLPHEVVPSLAGIKVCLHKGDSKKYSFHPI